MKGVTGKNECSLGLGAKVFSFVKAECFRFRAAVEFVSDDWVSCGVQVNADLMLSAGLGKAIHE